MIKKLYTDLYADENILYFNEDAGNVVFYCNKMGTLNIDLNNINLDNNFDEDDPDTVILIRLLVWHMKFEKRKAHKKYKWRINANNPKRRSNFCKSEDEKKEIEPNFAEYYF